MIENTPGNYRAPPAFSVVFYKLALLSPDPKSVLADFRMPREEFGKYVGLDAYAPGVPIGEPAFRHRIISLVTPSRLGAFYWRHPQILRKVLLFDFHNSVPDVDLSHTPTPYGRVREVDVDSGKHPFDLVAWGRFRRQLFSVAPFHLIYLFGTVFVLSGFCVVSSGNRRRFPLWPVALTSALIAVSSFLFASLFDAVETTRHLVFFQAATDLTIFSVVLSICIAIENLPQSDGPALVRIAKAARSRIRASRYTRLLYGWCPWSSFFGSTAMAWRWSSIRLRKPHKITGTVDGTRAKPS